MSAATPPTAFGARWMPSDRAVLLAIVLLGVVFRLSLFTGMALGDDVFYSLQAIDHAVGHTWPPQPYHWQTRLGITGPATLSLWLFGLKPFAFVLWPLIASTAAIVSCYAIARELVAPRVAALAALFQACFPLDVIYGTHLFPDVAMGLFLSLSLWQWIKALRTDSPTAFFLSGLSFGAAYLCRESVLVAGPTYVALWVLAGRLWRPRLLWVALGPVLVVGGETLLFWATTGDATYRLHAAATQAVLADSRMTAQVFGSFRVTLFPPYSGGGFWLDPLLLLVASHEFAGYHVATALVLVYVWRRWPTLRPLALWWLVTFVWHFYGTTVPNAFVPLARDPRYVETLAIPAVIMLAQFSAGQSRLVGSTFAAALLLTGAFAATLDQGNSILSPHKQYLESPFVSGAVLEPFEDYGARWSLGLDRRPTFACATDFGRKSVVDMLAELPGTVEESSRSAPFVVLSPQRRPDVLEALRARGWTPVASFGGTVPLARQLTAMLLRYVPTQRERASLILQPAGLIVLARPS